jgi:hypothetical protein
MSLGGLSHKKLHQTLQRLPTCTLPAASASSTPRTQKIWLTASTTMAGHSRTQEVRGRVTYACVAATTCSSRHTTQQRGALSVNALHCLKLTAQQCVKGTRFYYLHLQ